MAGKGRAPCCDKSKVKRGPWSPAEDLRLITFIQNHGHDNWRALPKQAGLLRCGKSCRLRWINYLRPDLKRGNFTKEEEDTIINLHQTWGNKWSKIASSLPGRTDNEIKNVWNTHLKKKVSKKFESEACGSLDNEPKESCITSSSSSSSNSFASYEKQNSVSENPGDEGSEANGPNDQLVISTPKTNIIDPKEVSSNIYDSSISSSSSINYLNTYDDQVGIMSAYSPIDFGVDYDDFMMTTTDGSDQNAIDHQTPLEICEDFWNMLDNLDSFVSDHQANHDSINQSNGNCQSSNLDGEVENCKPWVRYLEDELGLNHDQPITTSYENKQ